MQKQDYYNVFFELGQQKINFNFFDLSLPDDDPVYTLKNVMEELDFTNLLAQYSSQGRNGYNPIMKYAVLTYSIVETAKANRVNVLIYLQYLFEQIPLRRAEGAKEYMEDMMPWSEGYRMYEEKKQQQRRSMYRQLFPEPERPRTPRKRDRITEIDLTA